jgi:hypothetical protein
MRDGDALPDDMRRLLASLRSTPPPVDDDTIDRLLAGRLDPADAPPGYAAVARLLAAATAPAGRDELAGERAAVAEFLAVAHAHPPTPPVPRRAGMPSKLFRIKAAAAVIAAVLSLGGVAAAATGILPAAVQRIAGNAPADSGGGSATGQEHAATGSAAGATTAAAGSTADKDHAATGPDASGAARDGLCQAWLAGQGDDHGMREDSTAFKALAQAAGGADKVAAYCEGVTPSSSAGQAEQHRTTPTTGPPPSTGPPADPGSGQGQGGPPVTTG